MCGGGGGGGGEVEALKLFRGVLWHMTCPCCEFSVSTGQEQSFSESVMAG